MFFWCHLSCKATIHAGWFFLEAHVLARTCQRCSPLFWRHCLEGLTRLQTAPRCPVSELGKSYAEFLVRCQIAFCQLKFAADAPGIPRVSHLAGQDPHAEKSDAIAPPPNHPHENWVACSQVTCIEWKRQCSFRQLCKWIVQAMCQSCYLQAARLLGKCFSTEANGLNRIFARQMT